MASLPESIQVNMSDEFNAALKETREELLAAREALSEDRIRQIIREELATWEKSLLQRTRILQGLRSDI